MTAQDRSRQPNKADRNFAALAQAAAGEGNSQNTAFAQVGAVATGSIPTTGAGVVIAAVQVTPKFSGNFFVEGSVLSNTNATGASGATLQVRVANYGASGPTVGTSTATGITFEPAVNASVGTTASVSLGDRITGLTVGTSTWLVLEALQGVAGAYALASGCGYIRATEVP